MRMPEFQINFLKDIVFGIWTQAGLTWAFILLTSGLQLLPA